MSKVGEITGRLILGPTEMVAEYENAGLAAAAKANLDIFLQWALAAEPGKPVPPPLVLVLTQAKLDAGEDRPRPSDWSAPPQARLEGAAVVIDAPRSKHGREVVRKVLANSKPVKMLDRPKKGTGSGRLALAIAIGLAVAAAAVAAVLHLTGWIAS